MTTARASALLFVAWTLAGGAAGSASGGCRHGGTGGTPANPTGTASAAPSTRSVAQAEAGALEGGAADAGAAGTIVRTEDDGRTIDVVRGSTVTFELERHAGTGFEWVPAPLDGGALVQHGPRRGVRTSDIAGAPRLDVYEFDAETPGAATIEMQLRRPWQDQAPVKTVRVTVKVHELGR